MPTYRTTNDAGRNAHAAVNARPPRSKAPYIAAAVIAVAVIAAAAAVMAFAFGNGSNSGAVQASGQAEPMASTTFSEALPAETVVAADDVVMTIAGDRDTYVLKGEEYIEAGCHAVDPDVGDITSSIETTGTVNSNALGDYEITYTATTADGAKAQAKRNVHVVNSFDAFAQDIPVLMYHYVYSADDVPSDMNNNYILNTKLAEQCAYLRDNDFYFPSHQELRAWVDGTHTLPAKSVILTFDDGEAGFLKHGIPVLEEYEVPATSFVVAKDAAQNVVDYASPFVQFESHSYDMHRAGSNVGKGGIIHALSQQEIYDDIMASNEVTGGDGAVAMAYPFGDNNEAAWAALDDAGVLCAYTVKNDRIHVGDNPMALNRVRLSGEYSLDSFVGLVEPSV